MLRSEAKDQIIREPQRYLQLDNQSQHRHSGKPSYICPICGSGTGKKGTGITSKDGIHFTCWAGCLLGWMLYQQRYYRYYRARGRANRL